MLRNGMYRVNLSDDDNFGLGQQNPKRRLKMR